MSGESGGESSGDSISNRSNRSTGIVSRYTDARPFPPLPPPRATCCSNPNSSTRQRRIRLTFRSESPVTDANTGRPGRTRDPSESA